MKTPVKLLIVGALALAVVAAVALKQNQKSVAAGAGAAPPVAALSTASGESAGAPGNARSVSVATARLPRLLDLGADRCVPCKMMAPILEELKKEYAGRIEVEFIDVWKNHEAGQRYGIQMIPTQIFYDAEGRERARHVGVIGKDDILAKFREPGVELPRP